MSNQAAVLLNLPCRFVNRPESESPSRPINVQTKLKPWRGHVKSPEKAEFTAEAFENGQACNSRVRRSLKGDGTRFQILYQAVW